MKHARMSALLFVCLIAPGWPAVAAQDKNCRTHGDKDDKATMRWQGPCLGGWAHGSGVLEKYIGEQLRWRYEGMLEQGRPHGHGYLALDTGIQSEGSFRNGSFEGHGVIVFPFGSRYEGEVKGGIPHGYGVTQYATGGRHEGTWENGNMSGKAVVIDTAGRHIEFDRVESAWPARVRHEESLPLHRLVEHNRHAQQDALIASGGLAPYWKTYSDLTAVERSRIRSLYPMLNDMDEPPYPLHGLRASFAALSDGIAGMDIAGTLRIMVSVDADGVARKADVYASPDPGVARLASFILMKDRYKPALCAGTPCPMRYPFEAWLGRRTDAGRQ